MRWLLALVVGTVGLAELSHAGALNEAAGRRDAVAVDQLLQAGADVNARGRNDETPLMAAALAGDTTIAEVLLEHGADVMARNRGGLTPLHAAAYAGSAEVARMLLEHGAELEDRENVAGATPLIVAAEENSVEVVELLIETGADVSAVDRDGFSALTQAWAKQHMDVVRLLKQHGATCQPVDVLGTEDYHRRCVEAGM